MDLYLSISDGFVKTKINDNRADLDFNIVNYPSLDGDFLARHPIVFFECPVLMTLILGITF